MAILCGDHNHHKQGPRPCPCKRDGGKGKGKDKGKATSSSPSPAAGSVRESPAGMSVRMRLEATPMQGWTVCSVSPKPLLSWDSRVANGASPETEPDLYNMAICRDPYWSVAETGGGAQGETDSVHGLTTMAFANRGVFRQLIDLDAFLNDIVCS